MASFDASVISQIPTLAGDPMGAVGQGLTLANMVDKDQLQKLQLNQAKQSQEESQKAKAILSKSNISTPEGLMDASEKLNKAGLSGPAMDLLKTAQGQRQQQLELDEEKIKVLEASQNLMGPAALQIKQTLASQGPAMARAQYAQVVSQLLPQLPASVQAKVPAQPPQDDRQFSQLLDSVINTSSSARQILAQQLATRKEETAERSEKERERHDEAMEGAANRRIANANSGELAPEDLSMMADQYLAGDKSVFQNIGRGAQGSKNIIALRSEVRKEAEARGMSGKDVAARIAEFNGIMAGERTLGTRTANVEMAVNEAYNMIDIARQASHEVSRSGFMPLAQLEQAYQKNINDPNLAKAVAATNSLINAYARAVSPSGTPTVADKDHAREVLSTAQSQEAYDAVLDQLANEMEAARASPGQVRKEFREGVTSGQGVQPKGPAKDQTVSWNDLK